MTTEPIPTRHGHHRPAGHQGGGNGAVYGIGLIGAWVYYFRRATTLEEGIRGFFKGLVWPAFMVYNLLKFLEKE